MGVDWGGVMNAKDDKKNNGKEKEEPQGRETVPSDLDETTHAELRLLYREAADNVLFAKTQQWKTVGSTLVVYISLIAIAKFVLSDWSDWDFLKGLQAIVFLVAPAAILILLIYQVWQHTEQEILTSIGKRFSSLFRDTRAIKSRLDANVHRYILLVFMISMVLLGGVITYFTISAVHT